MLTEDAAHELAALTGVVLGNEDVTSAHDEICRIAVRVLPAADGASLTTFTDKGPTAGAASDEWARGLDELQFSEHEGPCLDCVRTGNMFRVRDLAADPRWPSWGPRALQTGARSTMSVPLTAEGRRLGALNLYSRAPDAFDAEAASVAEVVTAHAGLASQVAASFFGHRDVGRELQRAMASRAVIEQAKGVLMAVRAVSPDDAFAALVTMSQTSNRKLRDVAADVVAAAGSGSPGRG